MVRAPCRGRDGQGSHWPGIRLYWGLLGLLTAMFFGKRMASESWCEPDAPAALVGDRKNKGKGSQGLEVAKVFWMDSLVPLCLTAPDPRLFGTRLFHLFQTAWAQPDQHHIAQDVFLALRDPLALPANFQREHCPLDVVPHPNPIFRRRQFCHIITYLSLDCGGPRRSSLPRSPCRFQNS